MPEMRGVFYAMGPGIVAGSRAGLIHVTEVYPLMLSILGLDDPRGPEDAPGSLSSVLAGMALPPATARP